eukprot:403355177
MSQQQHNSNMTNQQQVNNEFQKQNGKNCNQTDTNSKIQNSSNNGQPSSSLLLNAGSLANLEYLNNGQDVNQEESIRDNLKLILSMMVDDVWKNYEGINSQKRVLESRQEQQSNAYTSNQYQNESLKQSNIQQEQRVSIASAKLNRDFIEPLHQSNKNQFVNQNVQNKNQGHQKSQQQQQHQSNHLIIDDISSSDMSDQSMLNPATAAAFSEDKENIQMDQITNIKHQNNGKFVFNYNSNTDYGHLADHQKQQIHVKTKRGLTENIQNNRRHTEQHHYMPSQQYNRLQSESEMILSQFQTPQYKASEIGNPISSPHTDERDSLLLQQRIAKQRLLGMNLLSQENSAKEGTNMKKQQRIQSNNYMTNQVNQKDSTLNLEDLDMNQHHYYHDQTPQNLTSKGDANKMQEIMLKNIWEIENNPIFSSSGGGSINDEKDFTTMNNGVIKQFNKDSFKDSQINQTNNYTKVNFKHIDLQSDDQNSKDFNNQDQDIDNYPLSIGDHQQTDMNNASNYDGPIQIDDDSYYNNDQYSQADAMEDTSANQYITHKKDYNTSSTNQNDLFSESRVPVTSIDGQMPKLDYKTSEGVQTKISKLNLNQATAQQSQPNLLFQFQQNSQYETQVQSNHLVMDQEYLKNIPKTGRDHYTNKAKQNQTQPIKNTLKAINSQNNIYNTTQDSNSLMISSDQPTKLSAEEVIRNYTNANFIPQKQAGDRLHLLCQSRELNPLVSLSVENDDDLHSKNHNSPHKLKGMPQTARVNSQNKLVDSPSKKRKNELLKDSLKYQQLKKQSKRENQNQAPKYVNIQNQQINHTTIETVQHQNNQGSSIERSASRSKTPINARPVTSQGQQKSRNLIQKNHLQQQCLTQANLYKRDDSVFTTNNDSKVNNHSLLQKLATSTENDRRQTISSQPSAKTQAEGRYIVNKLAKVIKAKVGAGGSSSQSRNSQKKQSSTQQNNNYDQFLSTQQFTNDNHQQFVTHLGQVNLDSSNNYIMQKANLNNSSGPIISTSLQSKSSSNTASAINYIPNKGSQTTKYQQFTLSQQRTDSQQSFKSNISHGNQTTMTSQLINHPQSSQNSNKMNKFAMRRFTADATNDEQHQNHHVNSQQNLVKKPQQQNIMNNTQLSSNVLANIGQSNSSKNLNQTQNNLSSQNNLPPHQRSMVHLHQAQGTLSPQQIIRQMKQHQNNSGIGANSSIHNHASDSSQIVTSQGSTGLNLHNAYNLQQQQQLASSNSHSSSLGYGPKQMTLHPQSAQSSKQQLQHHASSNALQNSAASAQAVIYGKLIKKQRKKVDLS